MPNLSEGGDTQVGILGVKKGGVWEIGGKEKFEYGRLEVGKWDIRG